MVFRTETVSSYGNTVKEDANMELYEQSDQQTPQINQEPSEDQKSQLLKLIQKYPTITTLIQHKISTNECQPIRQKPYRLPPAYKEAVTKELEEMEKTGIVRESEREWSSPMVIVMKKDGSILLCVDFQKLNQLTKFDAYPMPRIDDLLDAVGRAKYLTTLDLAKEYWQVHMHEEDQPKTVFSSPIGLLQFTVMPFGLSGAPATF